jgi:phosphoribosyl 1,2-cyclic phosphodiesterase
MSQSPKSPIPHAAVHEPAKVRFWGVRGSIPVPGPQTVKFGGNTSCVEVRADGQIIILDAGSGLRPLGVSLATEFRGRPLDLTILITHTHWDHIQGFPFFAPAYEAQNRIRVLGSEDARQGLQDAFAGQMEAPYFPVTLSQMPGGIVFEEMGGDSFLIGSIRVSACRTNHPGICHGYRIETAAGSICYIPDHEIGRDGENPGMAAVAELMRDADLVILDSQYTAEEYLKREGWGHSAMEETVRVAREARAKRLQLFHHDPSHDDEFLDHMLKKARQIAAGSGMRVESASEGEHVTLAAKS